MRAEAAVASEEDAPTPAETPVIMLGPLEKSCVDELSDGVQSMDVRWDGLRDVFFTLHAHIHMCFSKEEQLFYSFFVHLCIWQKCVSLVGFFSSVMHFIIIPFCSWKHQKGLYSRRSLEGRKIHHQGEIWHVHLQNTQAWRQLSSRSLTNAHLFIMTPLSVWNDPVCHLKGNV